MSEERRVGKECRSRWAADACKKENPLVVTLNQSKVITAQFTQYPHLSFPPCIKADSGENLPVWLNGQWNAVYRLQNATNITGPWTDFVMVTNSFGRAQFQIPGPTNALQQFYRGLER